MNELPPLLEGLKIDRRVVSIESADVAASKECPAINIELDSQNSIQAFRGKTGDFYKGFPIIYEADDEIMAQ